MYVYSAMDVIPGPGRRWRNTLILAIVALLNFPQIHAAPLNGEQDKLRLWRSTRSASRQQRIRESREAHGTHHFLATSAISLPRGTGYYKNTLVMLNAGAYAFTSNLSLGAGVDLFSLITSRNRSVWYSRLQLSGSLSDMVHIGGQVFYTSLPMPRTVETPDLDIRPGFATGLGMITFGNVANQVTLSGGWAHDGEEASRGPVLGLAGMLRIFTNVALVTEHWLFTDPEQNYPMHSLGVRILGDHLAIDVGIAYDRELAARVLPIGLPFAAATLNF